MYIVDFKERLEHCCDPETFVDVLEITMEELMDAFEDRLIEEQDKFDELFDITEEYLDE
tara:strand:- start:475 stop:651 length:177 start_codon:yes stop_codon:yes gene_type:complete